MLFGVRSDFSDVRYSATCNYMNLYRGDLIAFAWSRAEEKIDFICQNNILFLIWFFQHNNLTGEIKTCQTLELGFTPYLFDGNPTQQFTDSYLLLFGVLSCFYLLDVLSCFYWMHFCAFIGCIIVLLPDVILCFVDVLSCCYREFWLVPQYNNLLGYEPNTSLCSSASFVELFATLVSPLITIT